MLYRGPHLLEGHTLLPIYPSRHLREAIYAERYTSMLNVLLYKSTRYREFGWWQSTYLVVFLWDYHRTKSILIANEAKYQVMTQYLISVCVVTSVENKTSTLLLTNNCSSVIVYTSCIVGHPPRYALVKPVLFPQCWNGLKITFKFTSIIKGPIIKYAYLLEFSIRAQ